MTVNIELNGKECVDYLETVCGNFKGNKKKDEVLIKTYGTCEKNQIIKLIDKHGWKKFMPISLNFK